MKAGTVIYLALKLGGEGTKDGKLFVEVLKVEGLIGELG